MRETMSEPPNTAGEGTKKGSATYLPDHEATLPALGMGGAEAGGELGGAHVAVGRVSRSRGLANDELVDIHAGFDDLEERRPASAVHERVAVLVSGSRNL